MNNYKVYPNDNCPCGSGKKYKKCCGKSTLNVASRDDISNLAEACYFYNINYLKGLELNKEFNRDLNKICDWMGTYNKEMESIREAQKLQLKHSLENINKFTRCLANNIHSEY